MATATCPLIPKLPRKVTQPTEVCDKYGNRWQFDVESNAWISRGTVSPLPVVSEKQDGLVPPDIWDKIQKLRQFIQGGGNYRPLKINPGRDAYWYFLRSSDKLFRFKPEADNAVRIEVDKARLFQLLMKQRCPGKRGPDGERGDRGNPGLPGMPELCFEPTIEANKLSFAMFTPTPLYKGRPDIELPNNHVPDISVRLFKAVPKVEAVAAQAAERNGKSRRGQKQQLVEGGSYDQLQHLAIYYHGFDEITPKFQRTRDLLVQQSMGMRAQITSKCNMELSKVLVLPTGSRISDTPSITILVDPTGEKKPRIEYDPQFPIDDKRTLDSIQWDPNTNIVCGSIFLRQGVWPPHWCVKSRQRGPDGAPGDAGECMVRIIECQLDNSSIIATCPIISVRMDCENSTIFTFCSDILQEVCVESIRLSPESSRLADKNALLSTFAAAETTLDECKHVQRFILELPEDEFPELVLYHWDPQPGCVTRRHYDRHKFNWIPDTDVPACDNVATWFSPTGVRPGKYPFGLKIPRPPESDECCQEDFFYCPNIQDGACPPVDEAPAPPPPPAP